MFGDSRITKPSTAIPSVAFENYRNKLEKVSNCQDTKELSSVLFSITGVLISELPLAVTAKPGAQLSSAQQKPWLAVPVPKLPGVSSVVLMPVYNFWDVLP